jgi:hypothetical protein
MTNLQPATIHKVTALATTLIFLCTIIPSIAQTPAPQKETPMTQHAKGTFDVKITPQGTEDKDGAAGLGRMSIDKQIHGDLTGTGKGEMLTGMSEVKGSGAYVAIERISGTLNGRTGSFILQHTGTMARGEQHLSITVVPDSGTGQLIGIAGTFNLTITDGKHFYDLAYTLPETP